MDNLVLIRVAAALDGSLRGGALENVRGEGSYRFRWTFVAQDRPRTIVVSLAPRQPWLGRPSRRTGRGAIAAPSVATHAVLALARRRLRGLVLESVTKPAPSDRRVELRFADGHRVAIELAPPAPALVVIDPGGRILARGGGGQAARERLAPEASYAARVLPADRLDPFAASAGAIDAWLSRCGEQSGRAGADLLWRCLAGIGREAAQLVAQEAARSGRSAGEVLVERLAALRRGVIDPVIEAPWPPAEAAELGRLDPAHCRLLAWEPETAPAPGHERFREVDPARTAGVYYEALEQTGALVARSAALERVLATEIGRLREVAARVQGDRARFVDPEIWSRRGEALLAGLARAERSGTNFVVEDPYAPGGPPLVVPAAAGASASEAAAACFRNSRRARRGLEHAVERAEKVAGRLRELEAVAASGPTIPSAEAIDQLEHRLRGVNLPVALDRPPSRLRGEPRAPVRLEGARMFRTVDGWTALVGKTGKDNLRLTFRIASGEDFWLHADGVAGAHVILKNEGNRSRPPQGSLEQAAAAAAWFSEARSAPSVDVRWTRRKYVRKVRGARAGAVRIKRSETIRVRPALPADLAQPL